MTGMPEPGDHDPAEPAAPAAPAEPAEPAESGGASQADQQGTPSRRRGVPGVAQSIWVLEHAQDAVTVTVGIVLIVLAGVLMVSGIVDFLDGSSGPITLAAPILVDRVLFVLILVEIVHTVVLSLRSHRLVAQPFIVVGLVAVIRRILFVLTPGSQISASTSELALLVAMVAVFVAGLIAVRRFDKREE
jgi:uncharacterized membrane protein (DUF373 family)